MTVGLMHVVLLKNEQLNNCRKIAMLKFFLNVLFHCFKSKKKKRGVIISDGTAEQDIQRRIGLACDGMNRLATVWKSKDL